MTGGSAQPFPTPLLLVASLGLGLAVLFRFELYGVAPGMDAPYYHAFNWAAAHHLRFGDEFISTYGPFGHLVITTPLGGLWKGRALFEGLLALGGALGAAAYAVSVAGLGPWARFGVVALLVYALALQEAEYRCFALVVLCVLLGLHARGPTAWLAVAGAGLLAGFSLLMRASLGFGGVGSLLVACVLCGGPGRRLGRLALGLGSAVAGCALGWVASVGSLAGLAGYLETGIELVRGYSSAVSHAPSDWWRGVLAFAAWVLLVGVWILVWGTPRSRISLAALVLPTFLAWKHGMVRQDPNHVYFLVTFGFFVLAVLLVDSARGRLRWSRAIAFGLACLLLALTSVSRWTRGMESLHSVARRAAGPLALPGLHALHDLAGLDAHRDEVQRRSQELLRAAHLPAILRERIGGGTVDAYPWDSSYVWANGLAWRPRPLPATFSTVSPSLDQRNASFFESPERPQFVLWHAAGVWSFDERHVFWDEPFTLRALLSRYDEARSESGLMLLQARAGPRFGDLETLAEGKGRWNEWLSAPRAAGVLLVAATFERSLAARAARLLFREDPVSLSLRFDRGGEVRYRFAPDHAASGLWVSPFPVSGPDVQSLLRGGPLGQVVAIRFDRASGIELSSEIDVTWLAMAPAPDPGLRPPPRARPAPDPGVACVGAIERLRSGTGWHGGTAVSAIGWVPDGEAAPEGLDLWLTDATGRALATDVSMGSPGPDVAHGSSWWAIARSEETPEEIGFVLRGPNGEWQASCNRIAVAP